MSAESGIEPVVQAEVVPRRRTIVTALPLKRAARERLAHLLDARVLDMRDPFDEVDMVLTPSCSPQLIGALQRKYPGARVVIVELDDWDLDLGGPVKRLLRAGADAYLLADSLDELAAKLGRATSPEHDPAVARTGELTAGSTVDDVIAAFLRESVEYATRVHVPDARP